MDCRDFKHLIPEHLGGANTDRPDDRAFTEHMSNCESCRKSFEELSAVTVQAGEVDYREPSDQYFESFPSRVQARIRAKRRQQFLERLSGLAAAAALVLVIGLALLLRPQQPSFVALNGISSLDEIITDSASEEDLQAILASIHEEEPSLLEIAQELEALTASVSLEETADWLEGDTGIYELLDQLDPQEGKALVEGLSEELG